MPNTYFRFKKFTIQQSQTAMKVTTDSCLFGAFIAQEMSGIKINHCLDIGTGTGLLSLMLAQKNNCQIKAIEIEEAAAKQATENFQHSPFHQNIQLIHSDVKKDHSTEIFDLIISNPPFYENELQAPDVKKNIAHHGTQLKLSELISIIQNQLTETGNFFLLLPFQRLEEAKSLIVENNLSIHKIVLLKSSSSHPAIRCIFYGTKNKQKQLIHIEEIIIKNKENKYTTEFITYLKDYYLAFE